MILELIERLAREAEKRGLEFLVIGGQAVIHHGYERMTTDVDSTGRTWSPSSCMRPQVRSDRTRRKTGPTFSNL